jgi:hypothetical protein
MKLNFSVSACIVSATCIPKKSAKYGISLVNIRSDPWLELFPERYQRTSRESHNQTTYKLVSSCNTSGIAWAISKPPLAPPKIDVKMQLSEETKVNSLFSNSELSANTGIGAHWQGH